MIKLTPEQCRVIGVMLEKEITTPDQYPLSLNSLTNGCNQKSNRDPVMELSESEVQNVLDELDALHQIGEQTGFGSRVIKYKHRFCNTEFGSLQFDRQQLAIVCVLLLRGPQTPGELRTRTNRLADFDNVSAVEASLSALKSHSEGKLVLKLEREPGKREARYAQLFSELEPQQPAAASPAHPEQNTSADQRISQLEQRVDELASQVARLSQRLENLTD